jgi:hypothetical protein
MRRKRLRRNLNLKSRVRLKRSKNSAPGPDGTQYEDINKVSDGEMNALIDIYIIRASRAQQSAKIGFIATWYYCQSLPKTTRKSRATI